MPRLHGHVGDNLLTIDLPPRLPPLYRERLHMARRPNVHIDSKLGYTVRLPSLFFTCTASSNAKYDTPLSFISDDAVPRGADIQMFLRGSGGHKTNPHNQQSFGWFVMDFRHPNWPCQVQEERERQEVLSREL